MKTEKELKSYVEEIKKMKVNEENKKIVLDFDNLNEINAREPSTRIIYLILLKHLLTFAESKGKTFKRLTGEDIREFIGRLKNREIKTQYNTWFNGVPLPKKILPLP